MKMTRHSDTETFYRYLEKLEIGMGGRRRLAECHGGMPWPERGVYFFFEPGELRNTDPTKSRVVRVGTHALRTKSSTKLWTRLRHHRGTTNIPGGYHRGSIFRLLAGDALMKRDPLLSLDSWNMKKGVPKSARLAERSLEVIVSNYLGKMTFVVLPVPDPAGPDSLRGLIERNSIALLSGYADCVRDKPSKSWLGSHSGREKVRKSGLWNNNHVAEHYDPGFPNVFKSLVTDSLGKQ